ncbi:hypothetical protein M407DRAFT_18140 [Tulasnella calospora MUT 4182]|uniref:Serine-threonine/tyrosine-protein kinase catalytic domain-containing protein n=1 Tax=Tulasnella calospora MUT 4182 TaxID=1051891 RepID=A0A0C3QW09_9AGAM|nr:hypothetical protein M407DRAFT_18140 [Tulasnella calospora MUT 4182]
MSGKRPFDGLDEPTILLRILQYKQPRQEDHLELPSSDLLWSLMRRCWSINRKPRPTMQEVVRELTSYIYDKQSSPLSRPSHRPVFNANEDGDGDDSDANLDAPNPVATTTGRTTELAPDPSSEALGSVTKVEEYIELDADSTLRRETFAAREVFERLNLESKDMVVVGRYIEAAAKIGLNLLEIVQTVNSNEDMSTGLGSNARKLADLLENLKELSGLFY